MLRAPGEDDIGVRQKGGGGMGVIAGARVVCDVVVERPHHRACIDPPSVIPADPACVCMALCLLTFLPRVYRFLWVLRDVDPFLFVTGVL